MAGKEILIRNPKVSPHAKATRRFAITPDNKVAIRILDRIISAGATPRTHSAVIELGAGDATLLKELVELDWKPNGLHAVDLYTSPEPLVNAQWHYIDLEALGSALKKRARLPPEIQKLKGSFDIVLDESTNRPGGFGQILCHFFVRPGGIISTDDPPQRGIVRKQSLLRRFFG